MSDAGLPVTQPISVWNKPLKADWKAMFKALTGGAKNSALGKWEELPGTGADLLSSIGLETKPGERAYLLIRRALTAAIHELVGEAVPQFQRVEDIEEEVVDQLDWSLEESELRIDRRFFERPADLSILEELKTPLADLLVGLGLDSARAKAVSHRLGTYFTFHLAQEWREHLQVYGPLQAVLEGPFAKAAEHEQSWRLYDAWLQKQAAQPVFGESFSLEDVYIPLRGYWEKEEHKDRGVPSREVLSGDGKKQRIAVDLHEEIEGWLDKEGSQIAVRLLSGGPGSGKSTFAKMLAAKVSRTGNRRVLYVPLHLLDVSADLTASIDGFVAGDRFLATNPIQPKEGERRPLLIFDGLDELSLQGKVGAEVATNFVAEVRATVDRLNGQGADIRVLITGRPVAVDPQRTHFRQPEQLLFALPYDIPKEEHKRFSNPELLVEDQRDLWWSRYGGCVNCQYDGLPKELQREDLDEITRQPLLNYLLALSYERGKVDFTRETSLNEIYRDLLDAVYERAWGPGIHPALGDIDKAHFERILEEIAVAAWHGNGRTTSVREIQNRLRAINLLPVLEKFSEGAEAGIGRLLLAFYFRRAGRREGGDATFEFTHKSFGEYLTARRILGLIETAHRKLGERKESFEDGWDERKALEQWVGLAGPSALEENLLAFLRQEVALRDKKLVRDWQQTLGSLLSRELEAGLPMERWLATALSFQQMTRWARNAEETLLASINACASFTGERSRVNWPTVTALGELILRLRGQRIGSRVLVLTCFELLEAPKSILHIADLHSARLRKGNFRGSELFFACLRRADLQEADLAGVMLRDATLEAANLQYANLQDANLQDANLQDANLQGANLRGADLLGANLLGANLLGANLREAKLFAYQLEEIDLPPEDIEEIRKVVEVVPDSERSRA